MSDEDVRAGLVDVSVWIDGHNAHRDPETQIWGRVAKIGEEHGEAIAALIGMTGQNPRKGVTHNRDDLIDELLDVAITALGAIEHLTGNRGESLDLLDRKIIATAERARRSAAANG